MTGEVPLPIDETHSIELFRSLIRIPSVTGTEVGLAEFVRAELLAAGLLDVEVEEFEPGRSNVTATRRGTGGGRRLVFVGHLDTVNVEGWPQFWGGDERADPFGGVLRDGAIWGRGAGDVKAGIAAILSALHAVASAGPELAGDVSVLFVSDEESGEPGMGVSAGMKHALPRLAAANLTADDLVVYVEPTQLDVYTAHMGFMIAEISVNGRTAYFGTPEDGADALRGGHAVLSALWTHAGELAAAGDPHPLIGRPDLLVTACHAGTDYPAVPGRCVIQLIRKVVPGESMDGARNALERVVRDAVTDPAITVDITYPAGRDHSAGGTPYETDEHAPQIRRLGLLAGTIRPGAGTVSAAPYWSENPLITAIAPVPAVYCAPGDIRNCHTPEEHVPVDEYLDGVRLFVALISELCAAH